MNVHQTVERAGLPASDLWPTLLQGSVLVDVGTAAPRGRLVHPTEHFASMGFPVSTSEFGFTPDCWARSFSDSEARRLTGNGMHVAAIGAWLHFVLAVTQRA